jgi:polyisoprenoid-binding protein YceI
MLKLAALAIPALMLFPAPVQDEAPTADQMSGSYVIDGVHSFVTFKVKHLGVANSYGRFNKIEGALEFDAAAPEKSKVEIVIDATTIDTANEKRDKHLRSPDFFNTAQFPKLSFESTSFKKIGDMRYQLTGKLTMLGETKEISFPVEHTGFAQLLAWSFAVFRLPDATAGGSRRLLRDPG